MLAYTSFSRLLGPAPDSLDVEAAFQLPPIRQGNVKQDNPIAGHHEFYRSLILSDGRFAGFVENGTHAGMRHRRFNLDACAADRIAIGASQFQRNCRNPDLRWLWRYLVLD